MTHIIVTSKNNSMWPIDAEAVSRALSRWKAAWDSNKIRKYDKSQEPIFMIQAAFELWILSNIFLGAILNVGNRIGVSFELRSSGPRDDMSDVGFLVSKIGQLALEPKFSMLEQ
jgi:hypothetical protein